MRKAAAERKVEQIMKDKTEGKAGTDNEGKDGRKGGDRYKRQRMTERPGQ